MIPSVAVMGNGLCIYTQTIAHDRPMPTHTKDSGFVCFTHSLSHTNKGVQMTTLYIEHR